MPVNNIPLIYYHSVAPGINRAWYRKFLTLEMKYFEGHLNYFRKNNYTFIQVKDILNLDPGVYNHKKFVSFSFDDGYLDNYIYVWPLLKKYKAMATFFINPDFVDKRSIVRKTLEDYWDGKVSMSDINKWGFFSWDEMRVMESSGIVDIQSHTLTHMKYFISDKIRTFHMSGGDSLYPIGNLYPERLPYYIEDNEFEKLIPYGYPFFESASSLIARKVIIKESFIDNVIKELKGTDWSGKINTSDLLLRIKPLYETAKKSNSIIESVETEDEYKKRVLFELKSSKEIIEKELGKKVEICCWPHGDNNNYIHKTAISIGYKATTAGSIRDGTYNIQDGTRLPPRLGLSRNRYSSILTKLKTHYRIQALEHKFPYYNLDKVYKKVRYGIDI